MIHLQPFEAADFNSTADTIALYLLGVTAGKDRARAGTWAVTAPRLGVPVMIRHEPGGSRGYYIRTDAGDACIVVNGAYPEDVRTNVLIHELAHHIMCENEPELQHDYQAFYDGEGRENVHHNIAQLVQALVAEPKMIRRRRAR